MGTPLGEPALDAQSGVWHRELTRGLAVVNPGATAQSFVLPHATQWHDLYGGAALAGAIQLPPASGVVLLRAERTPRER